MTQRKLTDDELQFVKQAHSAMGQVSGAWDVYSRLRDMVREGTTDGKPYVEPKPPIPDGYRKAVASDEGRADCKFLGTMGWMDRPFPDASFTSQDEYIVPVDRVPTDEDAKSRPEVAVRDGSEPWQKAVLYGVLTDNAYSFLVVSQGTSGRFKYCRHLYPGE